MKMAFYKATRPGLAGLFNILVRWWTRGPYSHSELVIEEYADGTCLCGSSSFLDGGVRFKRMRLNPDHWDIEPVDGDPERARRWFEERLGRRYDVIGLLGHIWRRGKYLRHRYICSEICGGALGVHEPWRYDPNGLYALVITLRNQRRAAA